MGSGFEITAAIGSTSQVTTFPRLPFVLCRVRRANPTQATLILIRVPVLTSELRLRTPADDLRTVGTGGPRPIAGHPGSDVWLAVVDPSSRAGFVRGWITNDRGGCAFFPKRDGDRVTIEARNDFGRL